MAHHARAVSANRIFALAGALLTLVFVLMVSRVFHTPTQKALPSEVRAVPAYETARAATTLDTDSDGMPDWEETLLGTDPNNADENGNGVTDGEERGELVTRAYEAKNMPTTNSTQTSTLTGVVARDLMSTYMQAIQSGKPLDAHVADQILANGQSYVDSIGGYESNILTREDIRVTESTKESRNEYVQNSRSILESTKSAGGEYTAMEMIVSGDISAGIKQFEASAQGYETLVGSLMAISIPDDVVDIHLALLNALRNYSKSLARLASLQDDPILAATGYTSLASAETEFYKAIGEWATYTMGTTASTSPQTAVETIDE